MKETISGRQGAMLIMMFVIGSSVLFIAGLEAKRDIWLAMLLAVVVAAILTLIYSRLCFIIPGKDFYGSMEFFFGKVVSKIIIGLVTWFAFDLCVFVTINFGLFVTSVGLEETPINIMNLMMMLTCTLAVSKGIEVFGRWNQLVSILVIVFVFMVVGISLPKLDIHRIQPILYHGWEPVIKGARGIISFPLAETVVFLLVLPAFKKGVNTYRVFLTGILAGGGIIMLTSAIEILIMGYEYAEMSLFPFYEAVAILKAGKVLSRLEIIAATVFTITVFVKLVVLLMGTSKGLSKIIGLDDYRVLIIPVTLLIGTTSAYSYGSITAFQKWLFVQWPVYSALFQIIIPIAIWIFIEIKYLILKKQKKLPQIAA